MKTKPYNRTQAIEYAAKWAYKRNPMYYNFENIGGDCTSFVSQCLYAGCHIMNYQKYIGWYYRSTDDRSPSWSGVEFLYQFLITNKSVGPRAEIASLDNIEIGDVVQLQINQTRFSHSAIIVNKTGNKLEDIFIATHTEDVYHRRMTTYSFENIRFLHIINIGIWK